MVESLPAMPLEAEVNIGIMAGKIDEEEGQDPSKEIMEGKDMYDGGREESLVMSLGENNGHATMEDLIADNE